jgi:hypothetical protein
LVLKTAPTEDKVDAEKEKFYNDLQTVTDRTPKSDTILDANAKLGKEDICREVSGKHTLHEISNRNGEMLLELTTPIQCIMFSRITDGTRAFGMPEAMA